MRNVQMIFTDGKRVEAMVSGKTLCLGWPGTGTFLQILGRSMEELEELGQRISAAARSERIRQEREKGTDESVIRAASALSDAIAKAEAMV